MSKVILSKEFSVTNIKAEGIFFQERDININILPFPKHKDRVNKQAMMASHCYDVDRQIQILFKFNQHLVMTKATIKLNDFS